MQLFYSQRNPSRTAAQPPKEMRNVRVQDLDPGPNPESEPSALIIVGSKMEMAEVGIQIYSSLVVIDL